MGKKEKIVIAIVACIIILKLMQMGIAMKILLILAAGYYVWKYLKIK